MKLIKMAMLLAFGCIVIITAGTFSLIEIITGKYEI
jgi:hypothetical protein